MQSTEKKKIFSNSQGALLWLLCVNTYTLLALSFIAKLEGPYEAAVKLTGS